MIERQRRQARKDVEWMIRKSGLTATVTKPTVSGEDSFYGPHESSETIIGNVPIEIRDLPPEDLSEIGADAVASVLPDSGVAEQDMLEVEGVRYRVTQTKPQNLFGAVTHLDLHLELEKRDE